MGKVLASKQEMLHEACVDADARGEMIEISVESLEDDDVCANCGNPLNEEPEPSKEDQRAAEGTGTTHSDVQAP